jgi:hypothetical protein
MLNNVTVIVPQFWKERIKNLPVVIGDHEKYIIWNNDDEPIKGAINSNKNYGPLSRWVVALLADTDYLLMLDNDIDVPEETVKKMLDLASKENCIVGLFGRILSDNYPMYSNGIEYKSVNMEVDTVLGRVMLVPKIIIPKILDRMINLNHKHCDDVIASLVNKELGNKNYIISGDYNNLDEGDVGDHLNSNHYPDRDNICTYFFPRIATTKPYSEPTQ